MSTIPTGRFFSLVPANSVLVSSYTPLLTQNFRVGICYGQSGNSPDTVVAIIWDEIGDNVVLYCTHQSGMDSLIDFSVVGNGVKKLDIKLINSSNTLIFLGAGWSS